MLSKSQIIRMRNLQPAAPRKQAVPYYETKEENDVPMQEKGKKKCQKVAYYEDRNHPAYVPKNKNYYHHDLRWINDRSPRIKKQHIEVNRRWKHDQFWEEDQAPKSVKELIATYGFDIQAGKNPNSNCPSSPTK
ncbi:protein CASC3-like isoform X2 [Ranitomeya variabilis]|uniref:protein CASC3-like isoform X2 n=1 Tax=Ranitomeya variabilis TaxID=490064 RepID=UPI004055CD97